MDERNVQLGKLAKVSDELASQGKTPMYISRGSEILGIIAVADTVKESAYEPLKSCIRWALK